MYLSSAVCFLDFLHMTKFAWRTGFMDQHHQSFCADAVNRVPAEYNYSSDRKRRVRSIFFLSQEDSCLKFVHQWTHCWFRRNWNTQTLSYKLARTLFIGFFFTLISITKIFCKTLYRFIHKSLRDFRTRLRNNQDRHGRKEHINR